MVGLWWLTGSIIKEALQRLFYGYRIESRSYASSALHMIPVLSRQWTRLTDPGDSLRSSSHGCNGIRTGKHGLSSILTAVRKGGESLSFCREGDFPVTRNSGLSTHSHEMGNTSLGTCAAKRTEWSLRSITGLLRSLFRTGPTGSDLWGRLLRSEWSTSLPALGIPGASLICRWPIVV